LPRSLGDEPPAGVVLGHSSTRPFVADEEVTVRSLMAPEFDLVALTASLQPALYAAVLLWALAVARRLRSRRFRAILGDREPRRAERAAQQWLRQLIPDQADRYAEHGFVEIDSTLIPGRWYRIHHNRLTDIYERGTPHRRSCLRLHDEWLPPTDRVIAEYFLIQGDELGYLETANISQC
jgi:hypothetical protein